MQDRNYHILFAVLSIAFFVFVTPANSQGPYSTGGVDVYVANGCPGPELQEIYSCILAVARKSSKTSKIKIIVNL
jgi:hypothetical protein